MDTQIGLLLDALKSEGLDSNTVVVLWSDHGWKLGEHAMWCKHTNFELDTRVPLIIRLPNGQQAGSCSDAMVELVDLFPTLCELAGTNAPDTCEGASLVRILRGQTPENWRQHALSQYKRGRKTGGDIIGYSIKLSDGRYTEWINIESRKTQAVEFYDHVKDPDENTNAAKSLTEDQSAELSERLKRQLSAR